MTTTMNIAMSRNAKSTKQASVLFLLSPRRVRVILCSEWQTTASGCPGHGTDGLGGEYAGKEVSEAVVCDSSEVASA